MSFFSKLFGTGTKVGKIAKASVGSGGEGTEIKENGTTASQIMEQMENTLAEVNGLTQKFVIDIEDIDDDDDDDFNFDFDEK
jgi:hypothetical protein